MKYQIGNRGSIKVILLILVLVAIAFVGMSYAKPYYKYYTLGSHTRDFLKSDVGQVEAIKQDVMKNAQELQIPLNESNLNVAIVQKIIKVKATWSDTVDFWGYYQTKLDFVMEEEF